MKSPIYVQIFSMTDHAQALHGRYQGGYNGNNAELQTSEVTKGKLRVSRQTKVQHDLIADDYFDDAEMILAYRHSDTGILTGTSETLFSIKKTPWEELPGLSFQSSEKKDSTVIKLWDQEMTLDKNRAYRIHFGKTIVFLKNFGQVKKIEFTNDVLSNGPAELHAEEVDENITIAPPSGSALQIKMGQETQN